MIESIAIMIEAKLSYVSIFVFVMIVIGLGLTVLEFRYGQPRRDDERSRQGKRSPQTSYVPDAAKSNNEEQIQVHSHRHERHTVHRLHDHNSAKQHPL